MDPKAKYEIERAMKPGTYYRNSEQFHGLKGIAPAIEAELIPQLPADEEAKNLLREYNAHLGLAVDIARRQAEQAAEDQAYALGAPERQRKERLARQRRGIRMGVIVGACSCATLWLLLTVMWKLGGYQMGDADNRHGLAWAWFVLTLACLGAGTFVGIVTSGKREQH